MQGREGLVLIWTRQNGTGLLKSVVEPFRQVETVIFQIETADPRIFERDSLGFCETTDQPQFRHPVESV